MQVTKAPEAKIKWGMLDVDSEKALHAWAQDNIKSLVASFGVPKSELDKRESELKEFGDALFDKIYSVGYDEGHESASCEENGEGL